MLFFHTDAPNPQKPCGREQMYIHFLNFQKKHHTISPKGHYLFQNQTLLRSEKPNNSHLLGLPEPPVCKSHTTKKRWIKRRKKEKVPRNRLQSTSLRCEAESNRCSRFCRPVPSPSAIAPTICQSATSNISRALCGLLSDGKINYFIPNSKFFSYFYEIIGDFYRI